MSFNQPKPTKRLDALSGGLASCPRNGNLLSAAWHCGGAARGRRDYSAGEERLRPASRNSAPVWTGERRCSVADSVSGDILIVTFDLTAEVVFVLGCSGLLSLSWALFLG